MNMEFKRKLPTLQEVRDMYPLSEKAALNKKENDRAIRAVFGGEDDRLVLVIGLQTVRMPFLTIFHVCAECRKR